jgi:hypothetical protein
MIVERDGRRLSISLPRGRIGSRVLEVMPAVLVRLRSRG